MINKGVVRGTVIPNYSNANKKNISKSLKGHLRGIPKSKEQIKKQSESMKGEK